MIQKESIKGETGIEFMTHECKESNFQNAAEAIRNLDFVINPPAFIRALDAGFDVIS